MLYPALLAVSVSAPLMLGKGFVGQKFVNTLFDSGANIIGINLKKKHVLRSAYTGKYIRCRTFSGRLEIYHNVRCLYGGPFIQV